MRFCDRAGGSLYRDTRLHAFDRRSIAGDQPHDPYDADQHDSSNDDTYGDDRVRLYVLEVTGGISAATHAEE